MLGSGIAGRARQPLKRMWSSRLAVPLHPASAGPVRYWQDQVRLAVKGAIAAVGAWALARYAIGQPSPYFAPLAALLGVYPTVDRSLHQGIRYVAGLLLGAALAIPAGMLLGPDMAAIATVVIGGVLISGWQRLGDQGTQVTFTALFALLLGGHQPLHYVTHRMIDVGIGVATGLVVNIVVFPPLQLRPAEHAIRQWGESIARALEDLGGAAADPDAGGGVDSWPRHDRQLSEAARRARTASRHARESLRWNPRAKAGRGKAGRGVPRPDGAVLDSLEELTARTRAVARSLPDIAAAGDAGREAAARPGQQANGRTGQGQASRGQDQASRGQDQASRGQDQASRGQDQASFGRDYAAMLQSLAGPVRQLADLRTSRPRTALSAARGCQRQLEHQATRLPEHSDAKSAARHLVRLTGGILDEIAEHHSARETPAVAGD